MSTDLAPDSSPVAVGALGGSGTRLIAELLEELGFAIGGDLNESKDNLGFTLLFKRALRDAARTPGHAKTQTALSIFQKAMLGGARLTLGERAYLTRAALSMSLFGHDHLRAGHGSWAWERARKIRAACKEAATPQPWGFKEPNCHIFLPDLIQAFDQLRYVHVVRNGADMAYSGNQAQLHVWAPFFDMTLPTDSGELPRAMLKYWTKSTRRVLELAEAALAGRFYLLNYDELCEDPATGVARFVDFLGIEISAEKRRHLESLPSSPSSRGRYLQHDWRAELDAEDLSFVRELGFPVD